MVSLGHISDLKDRFEFIISWKHVVKKFPQAKMIIVGGLFNRKSEQLIKKLDLSNNIILTGRVDHQDIGKYLIPADFGGVLLTKDIPFHKGFGTANIETMVSGLPVIVDADSNFFGKNFPINENEHFINAEDRDPKKLAQKFIELFENKRIRKRIGDAGKNFVKYTLTWEKIMDDIEQVYEDVVIENNKKLNKVLQR
jgi:glycosyltransferase involved in cell wall biosynthesis